MPKDILQVGPLQRGRIKTVSQLDSNGFAVLESALAARRPDVLMIDPLVAFCGGGNMNDNAAMALVMRGLKGLAAKYDCAVVVVHHTRKGAEGGDAEGVSGAAAIVNLARRALMPVPMTAGEGTELEVPPSEQFRYFRLVDAKANFTPRSATSPWFQLHSIDLLNAEPPLYPHGDSVQAVARVDLPLEKNAAAVAADRTTLKAILDLVDRGKLVDEERHPYSSSASGARNARGGLLEDAVIVVNHATAPRQWLPGDLKAAAQVTIAKMKGDGWIHDKLIEKGRFRNRIGLYVRWEVTPWPNQASGGTAPAGGDEPSDDLDREVADLLG